MGADMKYIIVLTCFVLYILGYFAVLGGLVYVAWHFISKWW